MTEIHPAVVTDPTDPRLGDFTALNDPVRRRQVERAGDYFVVEGVLAIERLLGLGSWDVRRLVVLPRVLERLAPLLCVDPEPDPELGAVTAGAGRGPEIVVADEAVLRAVVGFDLHRGALASVQRRPHRPVSPEAVAEVSDVSEVAEVAADDAAGAGLLLVAEGVNDHENLGALYRNAAAFGVGAVVLDPTSADPFYRRSVRVSLGHVLAVPTLHAEAFPAGIEGLHRCGVTTVALTPSAPVRLRDLERADLGPGPVAVVVGAEGPGLTAAALDAATHRVGIEMADGVDSLNVATAAAIALHHLRR